MHLFPRGAYYRWFMKEETKALIEWIKAQIRIAAKLDDSYLITTDAISTHKSLEKDAEKFLDSFPEIESHLCRGGYIQDKNGVPCCEGDQIINPSLLDGTKELGKLYWSVSDCRFYCKVDGKCHGLTIGVNGFEKVEE